MRSADGTHVHAPETEPGILPEQLTRLCLVIPEATEALGRLRRDNQELYKFEETLEANEKEL